MCFRAFVILCRDVVDGKKIAAGRVGRRIRIFETPSATQSMENLRVRRYTIQSIRHGLMLSSSV